MFDIKFTENLVASFLAGDNLKIVEYLKKESQEAKNKKRNIVSRRLDNLIKRIPPTKKFGVADLGGGSSMPFKLSTRGNNEFLIDEYFSQIIPEQVILNIEAKNSVATLFREWEDFDQLVKFGLHPVNKILLYGAPGTGKTRLAHAIANKLGFPLILIRLDELISSFLGKTGQNIREIFEIAREKNVVLLLDEIDTVAKHRTDERELGELKRIVTVLLQNIDLFPNNSVIIGATNHEEILDKAIWRRFPLKIKLDLPSSESRELLLMQFLGNIPNKADIDFIVKITENFSGSEIYDLVQYAIKHFVMAKKSKLDTLDLISGFFQIKVDNSLSKKVGKQIMYSISQHLKDKGLSLREIETLTSIPYTTLRDNIK